MVALLLLCGRLFRLLSYELFLRGHQVLAIAIAYALWMHIPSSSKLPRIYLLASGSTVLTTFALEFSTILYRNLAFRRGCSRALIAKQNGTVRMTIFPPDHGGSEPGSTSTSGFLPSVGRLRFRVIRS